MTDADSATDDDSHMPCDFCGRVMYRGSLVIDDSEGEGNYTYLCPPCSEG